MEEQLVPGDYTSLVDLRIRSQMDTKSTTNQVGTYFRGVPFTVYEVYDEKDGIVWGRVNSNTGSGSSRFVGLRVANQMKAHLEEAFEDLDDDVSTASALLEIAAAIRELVGVVLRLAEK